MQLENTQVTQERLKEELQMRRTELEKIDTLDDKIQSELKQLAEKSEQMRTNIDTYANVRFLSLIAACRLCETRRYLGRLLASLFIGPNYYSSSYLSTQVGDMRAKAEETRQRLEKMKAGLIKRKDLLRVIVAEKALKHQAKKAQLQENNVQVGGGTVSYLGLLQDVRV